MKEKSSKISAGLLMYRWKNSELEVLLGHPGGPHWADKDIWAIPKGLVDGKNEEDLFLAGKREFIEETGIIPSPELYISLGSIIQKSGKVVYAWGFENNVDPLPECKSNTCEIEYPKGSGTIIEIPEVDKIMWFNEKGVKDKMRKEQQELFMRLKNILSPEKDNFRGTGYCTLYKDTCMGDVCSADNHRDKNECQHYEKNHYWRVEDFFQHANITTIAKDVRKQIQEENKDKLVDEEALRRGQDWSMLANKIVGQEGDE